MRIILRQDFPLLILKVWLWRLVGATLVTFVKATFSCFSSVMLTRIYELINTWFSSVNGKIRYFKYEGGKWNRPFILNEHYYAPTFSLDGQTLYFLGGQRDTLHSLVWQSRRKPDGGWTEPSVYLKKEYGLYDFMPTNSGVCYVGSNAHGDESYIIVSAKETKDFGCELYISFRRRDKSWSPPVSLGPLINDGVAHRWGEYVTPDGKYLFYSRGTSPKDCHIYWVRFDRLLKKLAANKE